MEKISWWRSSVGDDEIRKVSEAISSENITQGTVTAEFEGRLAKALKVRYAVATTSGSVALLISLMAAGIKPGDEVIMPNRTWVATANAPMILGAKPVLVDVVKRAPLIDPGKIEEKITKKTRIILPVHLNGRGSDMEAINKIARRHDLIVIEDACQAMMSGKSGSYYGTLSDIGCFSLGVTKFITTGFGGVLVTNNNELNETMRLIRTNGTYDNLRPDYKMVGCNFKFSGMLAAMGIVQLSKADKIKSHLLEVYRRYSEGLKSIKAVELIEVNIENGEVPIYVEALCKKRIELIKFLQARNIDTRPALPNVSSVKYVNDNGNYPNSDVFAENALFLPCGSAQPLENVDRVLKALREFD